VRGKLTVGVRGNLVIVFFPDGSTFSKPIPKGMTEEEAIQEVVKFLEAIDYGISIA
jgi:hypothetical protein